MASDTPDRLPPRSQEAERAVLGSMLRDNNVIGDVVQIVRADSFYEDAHQKLFQAIVGMYDRGDPVELVSLGEALIQLKQVEDVGGFAYLAQLWDATPTAANAEYYAKIVRDRAMVRSLIHASTEILRDAYDQAQPAEEMLGAAERKIFEIAEKGTTGQTYTLEEAINEAYARIDTRQLGDAMSISGISTGYTDLDEITAGMQNSELILVAARPSVGKCLAHNSEIILDDGTVTTLEQIVARRQARLLTLENNLRFTRTEPTAYIDDGMKPVYRVTTRLGRQIETTASHPYLALNGWRPLSELKVGEHVAVPRVIPIFGQETMRECEVKLLAYLIGDGCLTKGTPEFTNGSPRVRDEFTEAVAAFGAVKVRYQDSNGTRTPSLKVAGDPVYIAKHRPTFGRRVVETGRACYRTDRNFAQAIGVAPSLIGYWRKGVCAPKPATFARVCAVLEIDPNELAPGDFAAISRASKNPLTLWLEELGLWGKNAHAKTIPDVVFRLTRPLLALFLNRLFATDGWATVLGGGGTQLGYATVSERLARQIQHLLLRFGVIASLRKRAVKYRDQRRIAWQLDITDPASIRRFIAEIGIFGKEEAIARVETVLHTRKGYKTNRDVIPPGVWQILDRARNGESWCSLARRAGLKGHTNIHVGQRGLSRPRLLKFAEVLNDEALRDLAASDVYWDEIVSIEPAGLKQVYDLTIPETHNFVANDVCVHNTAFALNLARNIAVDEHHPIFFVSLEQSRIEIAERLLCCQARVDSHKLRKGNLSRDDMDKLVEAGGLLREAKIFIDDTPGQGLLRIAANARRLKLRQGIKLVFIDYLQLIEPDNRRDPRQEQVAQISRRLKFLARELAIPVVALAQVNRSSEDRQDHRPRLADLRESGSLEQDSDTVMLLHRPDRYEPGQQEGIIEIIIGKQRNGPTGEITLAYIKQYMRFENFAVGTPFES